MHVSYHHLPPTSDPPQPPPAAPYLAIVIIEAEVADGWRNRISDWLVDTGCAWMMAWGLDATLWEDNVDWSFVLADMDPARPTPALVITTRHDDEPLSEVFAFAANCVAHKAAPPTILLLDIRETSRRQALLDAFAEAIESSGATD